MTDRMHEEVTPRFKNEKQRQTGRTKDRQRRARAYLERGAFEVGSAGEWKQAVHIRDGFCCRACGKRQTRFLDAHHLIFKKHCADKYRLDVRNGLTLCATFAHRDRDGCHQLLHGGRLKIRRSMLPKSVVECLAEQGLTWDEAGEPVGTLAVYFEKEPR